MTTTIYPEAGWRPDDGEIHVGDVNTRFIVEFFADADKKIPLSIAGASVLKLKFKLPGTTAWVEKTGTELPGWPDENRAYYDSETSFVSVEGEWELRGYAELPSGWKGHTGTYHFPVYA